MGINNLVLKNRFFKSETGLKNKPVLNQKWKKKTVLDPVFFL